MVMGKAIHGWQSETWWVTHLARLVGRWYGGVVGEESEGQTHCREGECAERRDRP